MKSVDPGILPQSHCSTFQPSEFARKNLIYMTWCGHYYCTGQYYMDRESYPEALLLFVRNGEMDVKYNNKAYTIHKGDVLLLDCVNPHYYRSHDGTEFVYIHFDGGNSHALVDYVIELNGGPVFRQDENMEIGKELYETALIHEKAQYSRLYIFLHGLRNFYTSFPCLRCRQSKKTRPSVKPFVIFSRMSENPSH